MKKVILAVLFCVTFSGAFAQNQAPSSGMAISFAFTRQGGTSTDTFAIWVEDSHGNFVRTLYATRFIASGAWKTRPQGIPLWVERSGISKLSKSEVDAFTGATPRTSQLNYRWNGLDKNGKPSPAGEYKVFLEGTLRGDNRVVYSAPFTLGTAAAAASKEAVLNAQYFGTSTTARGMITDVKVVYW